MTNTEHNQTEAPVRAAETLSAVLAAFAIEQLAEGALGAIVVEPALPGVRLAASLVLVLALLVTLVRFFHGNSIYLRLEYARWSHLEVPAGSRVAPPIRYLVDVFVHIMQYVAFVAAAFFVGKCKLDKAFIVVAGLLAFDAIWSGFLWFSVPTSAPNSHALKSERDVPGKWARINSISAVAVLAANKHLEDWVAAFAISAILALGFLIDYDWNYNYFFDTRRKLASVPSSQPPVHLLHFVGLYDTHDRTTDDFINQVKLIFAYFMESNKKREQMFLRKKAALTVGIYLENSGKLHPIFRYHDAKIRLKNRTFDVGESYIGRAFSRLRIRPDAAISYPKSEEEVWNEATAKSDTRHYQSLVVANIFLPGFATGQDAIGALIVTSDQPDYFTPEIHEPWIIALAREVGLRLQTCAAARSIEFNQWKIELIATKPAVIKTLRKQETTDEKAA